MFDVLGELFEGHALRDFLVDAIRYGDRSETKAELFRKVGGAVDVGAIEQLVAERKPTSEGMDASAVATVREEMERAQAAGCSRTSSAASSAKRSRCWAAVSPNERRAAPRSCASLRC